ncbi:unnamed protein product [Phytophthora fragariaefolia]|uniref:Unnamed protein product n=1 Tax=Phytophthora fragariaefolia TaxID=1490495 RepID=A0A9W7CWL3_9STRA|nr:unnamed protein product [Phytophthora fragariaefolia]
MTIFEARLIRVKDVTEARDLVSRYQNSCLVGSNSFGQITAYGKMHDAPLCPGSGADTGVLQEDPVLLINIREEGATAEEGSWNQEFIV